MNNSECLRLVSRARIFSVNRNKNVGTIQLLAKRSTLSSIPSLKLQEKEKSHDALPAIVDSLLVSPKISKLPDVESWIKKVLEHNLLITGGEHSVPSWAVMAYEMLEKPENITEEYLKLSRVLGWCVEMTRSYLTVVDDIIDGATTRSGSPCWHRMPNVGMGAVNDVVLMSCCITETIETYFMKTPHYVDLLRLFHESILYLSMGQNLDLIIANGMRSDYSLFTMERFETKAQYKTSFILRLSILAGMTLVKNVDKRMYAHVDEISSKLGKFYTLQDDYMDCYGDETLTRRFATDIQERKCTWLAVTALQLCNPEQRDIFTKHYGSEEPKDVAIIKRLYDELQIPELYKQKEKEMYDDIVSYVHALPSESASKFFFKVLDQFNLINL